MNIKKTVLFGLTCVFVLIFAQACMWPFVSSFKISSMKISYNSGALPPDYYEEGVITIVPDYELRTIAIDYVMDRPFKQNKTAEDSFSGDAVIGGEYFDRFEDVVEIVREGLSASPECVGAHNITVALNGVDGTVQEVNVSSCPPEEEKASTIETFYSDVVLLLTKNVF